MPAKMLVDFKGIVSAPGQLLRTPASFERLENMVQEQPGVIRSRRGFSWINPSVGTQWKLLSTQQLGTALLSNYGNGASSNTQASALGKLIAGVFTGITTTNVTNQPDKRMMGATAQKNHYLTFDEGVMRLESDLSTWFAGMPKGLGLILDTQYGPANVLVASGANPLPDLSAWSYRVTICKKDQQGVVMEGPPGTRSIVRNATGTTGYAAAAAKSVTVRAKLPKAFGTASTALTTAYFIRVYRSAAAVISVGPPDDEHRLVYEKFLTAGDITNGYVETIDATPDNLRGAYLHTNPNSGEDGVVRGIGNSNDGAPMARDVAYWQNCMWYAEITERPTLDIWLLTTLTNLDTFTIGGQTYTGKTAGPAGVADFRIFATGTVTENIERTAQFLIETINAHTVQTGVWAYYVSGPFDLPGRIRFESRTFSGFSASSSRGTAWKPDLTSAVANDTEVAPNAVLFSKPYAADAVPRVNRVNVGPRDATVFRVMPLRDANYFFTDYGLYRMTGTTFNSFTLREFDLSFRLLARESVVVCDDAIYALGYQGIARITEAGVQYVSKPIEQLVSQMIDTPTKTVCASYAFGVAHQSQHRVLFFFPAAAGDQQCIYALCFDTRLGVWTRWVISNPGAFSCGVVFRNDDLLYCGDWSGSASNAFLYKETRTYALTDYTDVRRSDGGSKDLQRDVWLNFQAPEGNQAVHWQELHIQWETNDVFSALGVPTGTLLVTFETDAHTSAGISISLDGATRITRVMIPKECRRASRLRCKLSFAAQNQFFGIAAMALQYQPGSHRTVK